MENKKKLIIVLGVIFIFIFVAGIVLQKNETENSENLIASEKKYFLTVAACPTFHYMLEKIENNEEIKIIKTQSTAESLDLLRERTIDLIISGRALKSTEPKLSFKKIGSGYDFIFNEEIFILEEEMRFIPFYTNLSLEKIIEDFTFISEQNLTKTEDIYKVLDKGIIITFLEDEMKGEMVHIFQENEERMRLSRLPRLYYSFDFEEEKVNFIKEIIKEN